MEEANQVLKFLHQGLTAKLVQRGLSKSPGDTHIFWMRLLSLFHTDAYLLNRDKGPIVFIVNAKSNAGTTDAIDQSFLKDFFDKGRHSISNVIYVDQGGKLISSSKDFEKLKLQNISEVSDDSAGRSQDLFYVFVKGNEVQFIHRQVPFYSVMDFFSMNDRIGNIVGRLPVQKYRTIIEGHYNDDVDREKGFFYWEVKADWKLMDSPEEHFRKHMANYIKANISDGYVDEEVPNAGTSDRPDIRIIEFSSRQVYLIEIKWAGKSVKTTYDANDKANQGINQLHTYIKANSDCIRGVLVFYDARKEKVDVVWTPKISDWDSRIDPQPFIFSLDPTSASTKAKIEVAAATRASGGKSPKGKKK